MNEFIKGLSSRFEKVNLRAVFATGLLVVIGVAVIMLFRGGPVPVSLAEVKREDLKTNVSASAKVAPPTRELNFGIPGRLAEILVSEGDTVVEGQRLASLDGASLVLQEQQAEANVSASQTGIQLAESAVRDAQLGVQVAELNLAKLVGAPRPVDRVVVAEAVDQAAANLASAETSLANVRLLGDQTEAQAQEGADSAAQSLADAKDIADQVLDIAEQAVDDARDNEDNAQDYLDEVEQLVDAGEAGFNQATLVQAQMQADQAEAAVGQAELQLDLTEVTNDQTINAVETAHQQAVLNLATTKASNKQNVDAAQGLVASANETHQQALAQLDQLLAKPRAEDIELARTQVAQAKNGLDAAERQQDQAEALDDAADSALGLAEEAIEEATLTAPVSGRIGSIEGDVGELIIPPTPGLPGKSFVTLVDVAKIEVEAEVDDDDVSKVKIGQEAEVRLDAYSTQGFTGQVVEIPFTSSTNTVGDTVYKAKIEIDELPDISLRLGMEGEAEIKGLSKGTLTVPRDAVVVEQDRPYVFTNVDGLARKKSVKLGGLSTGSYEVLEGLAEGEEVIASTGGRLEDGSTLAIRPEK